MTLLEMLTKQRSDLKARAKACDDIAELRSIQEQIENIDGMIRAAEEERNNNPVNHDELPPAEAVQRGGQVLGAYHSGSPSAQEQDENPYASREYRVAFKNYVQRGIAIPASIIGKIDKYRSSLPSELRAGIPITSADTGAAIPFTVMNEVINTVRKRYGNLYDKVRKISVRGGVEYPVGALQAKFHWITEKTVSPRQKLGNLGKVVFNYHTGEIRVAQTFVSQLLTLEAFESEIVKAIALAYRQAMDEGIVSGSGDGQMTGILNDPRVTNEITMTDAQFSNWTAWRKNFFAKLPLGYRGGEFIFPVSTVDAHLETMADSNNNPIFRQATGLEVNDGDAMNPNGRFFGRDIALVEPDIIADFDSAQSSDVVGIYWQPEEYAINENFGFTMRRYFDEETNEWVDKALVVVDGKVLNPEGIWLIKKA